jgi:hypothetical protein
MIKNGYKKKIAKDIVRTWLDTVLNPLYDGLLNVNALLKDNYLSWDWGYRDFTEIKHFAGFFDYRVYPNFEQLHNTEFKELLELNIKYDLVREDLNKTCCELYDLIVSSGEMKRLFENKINEYETNGKLDPDDANYFRKGDSMKWIATYLINNRRQLTPGYRFKDIWNDESEEYFKILEIGSFQDVHSAYEKRLRVFKLIVTESLQSIKSKSNELSLNYGVPIVI